jgi:hypothetical protein
MKIDHSALKLSYITQGVLPMWMPDGIKTPIHRETPLIKKPQRIDSRKGRIDERI